MGGHKGVRRLCGRTERTARVEPEPSDPEHGRSDAGVGEVVWDHRFLAVSQPSAEHEAAHKRRNSRADMHNRTTGKVE